MHPAACGFAEEKDDQRSIDQKHILYRVILFLATVTFGLFSRVLGADDTPFRPVMGKRGEHCPDATAGDDGETADGDPSAGVITPAVSGTPSRRASAARLRAGASPRSRSVASNAGKRTWIH